LELESLFLEPFKRAQKAGVEVRLLARLCKVLCKLDAIALAKGGHGG